MHLQKLASASHKRKGERRIFTAAEAAEWTTPDGWAAIQNAMRAGGLPIIVVLGPNDEDKEEYRFGHMSYQEYLAGRECYQRITTTGFVRSTMVALFGDPPTAAFAEVKHHLMTVAFRLLCVLESFS